MDQGLDVGPSMIVPRAGQPETSLQSDTAHVQEQVSVRVNVNEF